MALLRLFFFRRAYSWKVFVGWYGQKFAAEKSSITETHGPNFQAFVVGVSYLQKQPLFILFIQFFNLFFSLCPACRVQNPRRVKMSCHHLHRLCVQTRIHSRQLLRHHFVPHRRKRRQTQRITALHYHVPPRRELWHHHALLQWNSTLLW